MAPIQTSQRGRSSTNLAQSWACWSKLLATFYLVDDSLSLNWPPLKAVQFIQLSLVSQTKGARHINLKTVHGKIDEVYGDKINIAVKKVFENMKCGLLILFEGRPGSGKTTLMTKISRDWANGELLQSKLVVLVQLRRLYGKEDVYLGDLFRVACSSLSYEDIRGLTSYIEGTLGKDVVFILDGLDEYSPGSNEDSFIYKLIAKQFFSESVVIVSSRPAATQPFRRCATTLIEVVGFMEKEVKDYIYSYFEDDRRKAEMLMKYLQRHPNLMNLCYLPLHCAMLVFLYEEDMVLPKTETEFYRDFTLSTLVRCNCKKFGRAPSQFSSFDDLSHDERIIFRKICRLAFDATVKSKQVFKDSELQTIRFHDANEDVNSLGLVVIDKYFVKFGLDKTYTFLHLTLQEYLSAVYVSRLSAAEQEAIIKEHSNKPHLFVMWRFLFGTLDYAKNTTANLFKLMMEATQEVKNSCFLRIQCAFESQNDLAYAHVTDFCKNRFTFSELSLTSTDVACIIHLLKCSKCTDIYLSFNKCKLSVDDARALLQGIGDCQLSLTLERYYQQEISLLDALNVVPVPSLVHLELYDCGESVEEFPSPKNFANLQVFKFDQVSEISGLEECFQHWPKLKELHMCNYSCDVTHAQAVIKVLKHCPQLERLTFYSGGNEGCLDESVCRALGETLQYLPNLQHIDLFWNENISDLEMAHLAKGLTHCTYLKELNLSDCSIGDSGAADLAEGLTHCVHLEKLNLDYNGSIGDSGMVHLAKGLTHCTHLKELNLRECGIGDSGTADLAKGLAHCVHLENLNLYCNRSIGDSGMAYLAKGLTHCTRLKELNLGICNIGDSGVADLTEGLTHCVHLEKLDLDDNRLTNKSIPCLEELIQSSRNLEKLVLVKYGDENKFTERGWSQLIEAVEQRNSTEGMSQLELVGEPTVDSEEESNESDTKQ